MDEKISATVRFNEETRAATDSYTKAYEVHLSMVHRSLRQIIYTALQQHYVAAEAYAAQNQSRTLILAFQRGLRRILEWDAEQRRRFIQSLSVEHATSRVARLPTDILHAISNLVHVLMFTDAEMVDMVENGLTQCPGFAIKVQTNVGDFVIQCLQEAALHFDGTPFLFARDTKPHQWIENRQKILNDIDRIVTLVVNEMATNMVSSVCRRLMSNRAPLPQQPKQPQQPVNSHSRLNQAPITPSAHQPALAPTNAGSGGAGAGAGGGGGGGGGGSGGNATRYTDTRLLYGHVDNQQYLEHAYTQGNLRHTNTPIQRAHPSARSTTTMTGSTLAESSATRPTLISSQRLQPEPQLQPKALSESHRSQTSYEQKEQQQEQQYSAQGQGEQQDGEVEEEEEQVQQQQVDDEPDSNTPVAVFTSPSIKPQAQEPSQGLTLTVKPANVVLPVQTHVVSEPLSPRTSHDAGAEVRAPDTSRSTSKRQPSIERVTAVLLDGASPEVDDDQESNCIPLQLMQDSDHRSVSLST